VETLVVEVELLEERLEQDLVLAHDLAFSMSRCDSATW
jgi:hypothetical protein